MTVLDKRLREIIYGIGVDYLSRADMEETLEDIHQVFEEAGYKQSHCYICERQFVGGDSMMNPTGHRVHKAICEPAVRMSGQEWYERFDKEWKEEISRVIPLSYIDNVDMMYRAAKRAAGIE